MGNVQRMAWDNNTRFPITAWPGRPLPLPPLRRAGWSPRLEGGEALVATFNPVEAFVEPPWEADVAELRYEPYHELYLQVCELDLADQQAILGFVQEYGAMRPWHGAQRDWSYCGFTETRVFRKLVEPELLAARERAQAIPDPWPEDLTFLESVEEFRWGATCIRDLVRAWRFANEGIEPDEWECPIWHADVDSIEPVDLPGGPQAAKLFALHDGDAEHGPPADPEVASAVLSWGIRNGIAPFHPTLLPSWLDQRNMPYGMWAASVYFVCCLELYNHIAEQAVYRRCASETCGKLFVRQGGGAVHGQYRTSGVKYCTPECARAQAQRAYRRRKQKAA